MAWTRQGSDSPWVHMTLLHHIQTFFSFSRYALIYIGCLFEGPIMMMTGGFLWRFGQFSFLPLYLTLVAGDFTADMLWYTVGRQGARRLMTGKVPRWLGITEERIARAEELFHKYHTKILIISKLTAGFGFALVVVLVAGMTRVPLRRYTLIMLLGGFVWTGFLVTVGYFFGNIYAVIPPALKVYFAVVAVIIALWALKKAHDFVAKKTI